MTIECQCFCGARYSVTDEHAGKRGQCPKCGNLIMIPTGRSEDAELVELAEMHKPAPQDRLTSALADLEAKLGPGPFARAMARGEAMADDEAIAFIRGEIRRIVGNSGG